MIIIFIRSDELDNINFITRHGQRATHWDAIVKRLKLVPILLVVRSKTPRSKKVIVQKRKISNFVAVTVKNK